MTAIFIILFFVVGLIHMGIALSIEGLFETMKEEHPEHKDEFSSGKLTTISKQKRLIDICETIDSYDSRRLVSLIQIDNKVLLYGVLILAVFGIINFIIN